MKTVHMRAHLYQNRERHLITDIGSTCWKVLTFVHLKELDGLVLYICFLYVK